MSLSPTDLAGRDATDLAGLVAQGAVSGCVSKAVEIFRQRSPSVLIWA